MDVHHILLPTDLSLLSQAAFPYAAALAKGYNAHITLLHVDDFSDSDVLHWESTSGQGDVEDHTESVLQLRIMLLEKVRQQLEDYGVSVSSSMKKGHPARQILTFIQENNVDLMVIAKHGVSGFKRLLIGSTSTKVIRKSRIPAMVVDSSEDVSEDIKNFRTILTTTDFSLDSSLGLRATLDLARILNARTKIINVIRLPQPIAVLPGEAPLVWPPTHLGFIRENVREELARLIESTGSDQLEFEAITHHNVVEAILENAETSDADLIVMPSHGKGAVLSALVGSTTMRVLKLSNRPVLILPPEYIAKHYGTEAQPASSVVLPAPPGLAR